jgi:ABC-type Mn2+/Zn2+ transport system ATPase subunit
MKLKLVLENCYGINKLNKEFDFTKSLNNDGVNSLYAPNGALKTSLAKTFIDVVNEDETKDLIFPDRVTKRDITINNVAITPEQIMVIESYNESYSSQHC